MWPGSSSTIAPRSTIWGWAHEGLITRRDRQMRRTLDAVEDLAAAEEDTATAFSAGVARWIDAAEALVDAAERPDVAEVHRAARALDAGTDEFLRAAAALRGRLGNHPLPTATAPGLSLIAGGAWPARSTRRAFNACSLSRSSSPRSSTTTLPSGHVRRSTAALATADLPTPKAAVGTGRRLRRSSRSRMAG